MLKIPRKWQSQVTAISEKGSTEFDAGRYNEALVHSCAALELIPEPLEKWEASTWGFTSIGDTLFLLEKYEKSLDAFLNAVNCPDGLGNPFIHLRLGQNYYELSRLDKSGDEMARAYMAVGEEIFEGEDPKYWAYLRTQIEVG